MKFLEKDLEQIIFEANPKDLKFINLCSYKKRQLKIPGHGVADLVLFEKIYQKHADNKKCKVEIEDVGLKITVCELKKDKIGISAFLQAIRYCKGLQDYFISRNFFSFIFEIVLIGKDLDKTGSLMYMPDLINISTNTLDSFTFDCGLKAINFYTYNYDFDGVKFLREGIYLDSSDDSNEMYF